MTVEKMDTRSGQYAGVGSCSFGVGILKWWCITWGLIYVTLDGERFISESLYTRDLMNNPWGMEVYF